MNPTVALLKAADGTVVRVFASADDARARAEHFNADPWVEPGTPDLHAPYTVEVWMVG